MPTFEWKGSRAGQMQSGVLTADSKDAAEQILRRQRIEAPSIKEKGKEIALPKFGGGVAPQFHLAVQHGLRALGVHYQ